MELEKILEGYIEKSLTDFAILVDGEWGSGKTFFIKNTFSKLLDAINRKKSYTKDNQYRLTYISLYGVNDLFEVEKRLFIAVNPKLKTKTGKTFWLGFNKLLQFINIDNVDKELINIYGAISKKRILVFDDLERLEVGVLNQVLGFINNYAEHQNLKIIILAHEENLKIKLAEEYERIKEKLIRFTYKFKSSIGTVFDTLICEYPEPYKNFLAQEKKSVLTYFNNGEHLNLRTLRFLTDIFCDIYDEVGKVNFQDEENRQQILESYLLFVSTYAIEYKKGTINSSALKALSERAKLNYSSNYYKMLFGGDEKGEEKEKSYEDIFEDRYLKEDFSKYRFYDFLESYIHSGSLIKADLEDSINIEEEKIIKEKDKEHYSIYKKLVDFELYEDEELELMIEKAVEYAKIGKYLLYDEYVELFIRLYRIASAQIIPTERLIGIGEDIKQGISICARSIPYKDYINRSFFYRVLQIPGVDALVEQISEENEKNLYNQSHATADIVIEQLQVGDFDGFYHIAFETTQNEPLFVLPFFKPRSFLDLYLLKNNNDKNAILYGLKKRLYKLDNYGRLIFEEEREFFDQLLILIDTELGTNVIEKISKYNLQQLRNTVERAISKKED